MASMEVPIAIPSAEEQRQTLYACLLRYTPEAGALRDRAMDRLVQTALLGSDEEHPYRIGRIQQNLTLGTQTLLFRPDLIQEALERLKAKELACQTELLKRHAYYLTPLASTELHEFLKSSQALFDPVVTRLLKDTSHLQSPDTCAAVCKAFMCEAFARFGAQFARIVTGQATPDEVLYLSGIKVAYQVVADKYQLSPEARETLAVRCFAFLRSVDPADVRLKFYLTQSYYFAQLIGLGDTTFDPVNEGAFRDSVFYLDTNVLFVGLYPNDGMHALFDELVSVAKRLGIELRVTRATINEVRRVVADRLTALKQLQDLVPTELIERTRDQLVLGFLEAKQMTASVTPEEYFEPINHLSDLIGERWSMVLVDRTEDEIIAGRDFVNASRVMQEDALSVRKFEKSEAILLHDVAHYALVVDDRQGGHAKTWFLTRDRSLNHAGIRLRDAKEQSFCFSLFGFLQTISPFLATPAEEKSVGVILSTLMTEQIFGTDQLFSVKELLMLTQMHQDVLATPNENLIQALDYVKSHVLQGNPYKTENAPQVALELRTFLASSADAKRKELEDRCSRLENETTEEREVAKSQRRQAESRSEQNEAQIRDLTLQVEKLRGAIGNLSEENTELLSNHRATQSRAQLGFVALGAFAALPCWFLTEAMTQYVWPPLAQYADLAARLVGIGLVSVPTAFFVRSRLWEWPAQTGTLAVVLLSATGLSGLVGKVAALGPLATLSTLVAALVLAVLGTKGTANQKS